MVTLDMVTLDMVPYRTKERTSEILLEGINSNLADSNNINVDVTLYFGSFA